jgi:hypothetical protein
MKTTTHQMIVTVKQDEILFMGLETQTDEDTDSIEENNLLKMQK